MSILRNKRKDETGSTMLMAIMFMIIMLALVATMTGLAIGSMKATMAIRDATYFDVATNTAVSDALLLANNPTKNVVTGATIDSIDMHVGQANAKFGTISGDTGIKWRWYAIPVPKSVTGLSYDIIATGYRSDPNEVNFARSITARMASFPTSGAMRVGDSVFYRPTEDSIFSWGVFGATGTSISGSTSVKSYNSSDGSTGTDAPLGSNEIITITPTSTVPVISVMNSYPGHTSKERCIGTSCTPQTITEYTYGVDLSVIQEWVAAACPLASYPDINISGTSLPLTSGSRISCFNNVTVSGNVPVDLARGASSGNPELIYIKGNLTVSPGTTFNTNNGNTSVSGAIVYKVYTSGATVNIGTSAPTGSPTTDFRALLTSSGKCSVGTAGFTTITYGALVCNNFSSTGTTTLNWDDQTEQITGDVSETRRIWNVLEYMNNN